MAGEIRIVMVGKTGAGKSSLGNTLLGKNSFQVKPGLSSGTQDLQVDHAHRFGAAIKVTDTPGLCDTGGDEWAVRDTVIQSLDAVYPGPHVILLVLRCDARFTKEEFNTYMAIKRLFGPGVCRHMIAIFNGIDALDDGSLEKQKNELRKAVLSCEPDLKQVMHDVNFRYFGVNNTTSRSNRDQQAVHIIQQMTKLVFNNDGDHFSHLSDSDSDSFDTSSDSSY